MIFFKPIQILSQKLNHQIILIKNGNAVYTASHSDIQVADLAEKL
jgi:hypothetical protein